MTNYGYWKFHRKMIENELFRDEKALRVFLWILCSVDYKSGKMATGRLIGAQVLGISPSSFYRALKRLSEKFQTISLKSNNKFTEIMVINWAKYQADEKNRTTSEQPANNKRTHYKEIKNKRNKEDITFAKNAKDSPKEIKRYKRLPLEKQTVYYRIAYFYEDLLKTNIVSFPKQFKAIKMMLQAGYTEKQITFTIKYMAEDSFYEDKGFDLMTVANNIAHVKASVRKAVRQPEYVSI